MKKLLICLFVLFASACGSSGGTLNTPVDGLSADWGKVDTISDDGSCVPMCAGRECGSDGCGGTCGKCPAAVPLCIQGKCNKAAGLDTFSEDTVQPEVSGPETVEPDVTSDTGCVPACNGKECGADGCGGDCGVCPIAAPTCDAAGKCKLDCVPKCQDMECGDDSCGGVCGTCGSGQECQYGECVQTCFPECTGKECGPDGCNGVCGTCPTVAPFCTDTGDCQTTCVPSCKDKECGDDGCGGDCGTCPTAAPICAGSICKVSCTPNCNNRHCGDDGCGGTCGTCPEGKTCNALAQCETACVPACTGKECGPDGCGGTCGKCPGAAPFCTEAGVCKAVCTPKCDGKECGSDGCDGTCGKCPAAAPFCSNGLCAVVCLPSCQDKECGADGCGGVCGKCPLAAPKCGADGVCAIECTPQCAGKECGPDGCGGTCGKCPGAAPFCNADGMCKVACVPSCTGKECGSNGCGGECGTCGVGKTCNASFKCETVCTPSCTGKECGPDGCGGECGKCPFAAPFCNPTGKCGNTCFPSCNGKTCGDDGCGGSCGTCPVGKACKNGTCGAPGCEGACGGFVDLGIDRCYCDAGCDQYGDCCDDVCTACAAQKYEYCCVPSCTGKVCGDDGCGGSCGVCTSGKTCATDQKSCVTDSKCTGVTCTKPWETCVAGQCVQQDLGDCTYGGQVVSTDCKGVTAVGCCNVEELYYCDSSANGGCPAGMTTCLCALPCATADLFCSWDAEALFLNCLEMDVAPPSGVNATCPSVACTPKCTGKVCGDNGCGGSCGPCADTETCAVDQKSCVPKPGILLITEFLVKPTKTTTEATGEWFEVYNPTKTAIGLANWTIRIGSSTHVIASTSTVKVQPGAYALLASSSDAAKNGNLGTVTYAYGTLPMDNTTGKLSLEYKTVVISTVSWGGTGVAVTSGKSSALDPLVLDATGAASAGNWCLGSTTYGLGDYGTPGKVNKSCGFVPAGGSAYLSTLPCAAGTAMALNADGTDMICYPQRAAGETCGQGLGTCKTGLDCVWDSEEYKTAHCLAKAKDGEPCSGFGQGLCAEGLFCNATDATRTRFECYGPEAAGHACFTPGNGMCVTGTDCVWTDATQKTAACIKDVLEGDICGDFATGLCADGLTCNWTDDWQTEAVCYPQAIKNETCSLPGYGDCIEGLDCIWADLAHTDTMCLAPVAENGQCGTEGYGQCQDGLTCNWQDATQKKAICYGPEAKGSACLVPGYGDCGTWLYCTDSSPSGSPKCMDLLLAGKKCGNGIGFCASGLSCTPVTSWSDTNQVCMLNNNPGEACGPGAGLCTTGYYCDDIWETCEVDPCFEAGYYGDGTCDNDCPFVDPDCE